ncbi:MAG: hypothetical protein JO044_06255 [Mycobacteriaceae bacterium]|nr:hypothetical protein [Mycobacteriaceae bacterium]MBV9640133.1 hypothetical protein [Mycobacteriaceae bacterium]
MRIRFRHLVLAWAALAIVGAPTAVADDTNPTCTNVGASTECSTPGNVQINATPPVDTFTLPYWDEVFGGAYAGPYPVPYAEGNR